MTTGIDAAIAAAAAKAAQAPEQTQVPAVAPTGGAVTTPGTPFSLENFTPSTMSVDEFLKVKEFGLRVGNADNFFKQVRCKIHPAEISVTQAIRWGNPAQYAKTFDGVMASNGMAWPQAIAQARQADPKASPYPSADIPMTALEDVKVGDDIVVREGTRLGYSLSVTNAGEFDSFRRALFAAGLQNEPVEVMVGYRKRTNSKGNVWGVVTFELLGAYAD